MVLSHVFELGTATEYFRTKITDATWSPTRPLKLQLIFMLLLSFINMLRKPLSVLRKLHEWMLFRELAR